MPPPTGARRAGAAAAGAAVVAAGAAGARAARSRRPSRRYALTAAETLPDGLRHVAHGRIDHALEQLRDESSDDPDKAVHEARKDLKKLRAVLRLARAELGEELYREQNDAFRDAGRGLAGARDAQVVIETLDALAEGAGRRLPKRVVRPLRERLVDRREQLEREVGGREEGAEAAMTTLERARERVDDWAFEQSGFGAIKPGLARAYARGRERHRAAERKPTAECLHEWRKRAKDLWYHQQLLAYTWPDVLEPAAEEAHRLSELLGDDHDLAVLADAVDLNADVLPDAEDRAKLHREISERRAELQAQAFALGHRLYAEKPKAFVRRLRAYFAAAAAG